MSKKDKCEFCEGTVEHQVVLAEYDFRGAVRGKYFRRYLAGSNVVVLAPDVAKDFPDTESVNSALRTLGELIHRQTKKA
jgi:hypothetical protein